MTHFRLAASAQASNFPIRTRTLSDLLVATPFYTAPNIATGPSLIIEHNCLVTKKLCKKCQTAQPPTKNTQPHYGVLPLLITLLP